MRITCLVDSLNSGGAQKQICMLAILLKRRGFDVQVLTYHKIEFFGYLLEKEKIPFKTVHARSRIHRIWTVRKAIQENNPNVVIAFLNMPSIISELSGLPSRNYKLIVSERNIEHNGTTIKCLARFISHSFADAIVSNSFAKTNFIKKTAPWLRKKTFTITNCVDLEKFRPSTKEGAFEKNSVRLLVLGRFEPQKNPMSLFSAIKILKKECPKLNVVVDWYGNNFFRSGQPTQKSWLYLDLKKHINEAGFQDIFRLHQPCQNIVEIYWNASVVCLPSLWEGCSNVLGEAMACGKPVLAGRVGDNEILVKDGENGFLFNPVNPRDIADSIIRFASLFAEERRQMAVKSRQRAEKILSPSVFIKKYLNLIESS